MAGIEITSNNTGQLMSFKLCLILLHVKGHCVENLEILLLASPRSAVPFHRDRKKDARQYVKPEDSFEGAQLQK